MTREQAIVLRAVGDALSKRLASVDVAIQERLADRAHHVSFPPAQITIPPPSVTNLVEAPAVTVNNEVATPSVTVQVDMGPVADAIKAMAEAVHDMQATLGKLLGVLAKQPAIEFKPNVTVEAPARAKRSLRIVHDDGTESVVSEE